MPHTAVDIVVIAVILVSAVFAFVRGLTREALSLGSWLLAIYLSFTQYPRVTPFLESSFSNPMIRDFVAGIIIFAAVMLLLLPIGLYLRGFVKGEQVTAIDRSLGFVFGAARGYLLVAILYLIVAWLMPEEKQPLWLREANTRPALVYGANLLRDMIPAEQRNLLESKADPSAAEDDSFAEDFAPEEESPEYPDEQGSTLDGKIDQLDQVIHNTTSQGQGGP